MRILFDTYTWIEYLEGSKEGEMARNSLQEEEDEIYTSTLSIAELSDAFHRDGVQTDLEWTEIQKYIELNSILESLNAGQMTDAGKLKVKKRQTKKGFGLIDAIILGTSIKLDAKLLTGDPHLVQEPNAIPLT